MNTFHVAYFVLITITLLSALSVYSLWRLTGHAQFVIGLALVYYYSIFGAWSIVGQKSLGTASDRLAYLQSSLFVVMVDEQYVFSLIIYGLFFLTLSLSIQIFVKVSPDLNASSRNPVALPVSHGLFLCLSLVSLFASVGLLWDGIVTAIGDRESIYFSTRGAVIPYYSLHQLANRIGLAALVIGGVPCLLSRPRRAGALALYIGVGAIWVVFLGLIGSRNELLMAAMASLFWYWALGGRLGSGRAAVLGVLGFTVLRTIEFTRRISGDEAVTSVDTMFTSANFWNPFDLIAGSESLSAHMSLYGVMTHDVEPTFGSSLLYLVNSLVPQALYSERVADSYSIYAQAVDAYSGQGFNIHYATGWYLNFGIIGVVAGAVLAAALWWGVFFLGQKALDENSDRGARLMCAFCFTSAFAPMLMRNGPEGLKGLIIEGMLIPYALAWLGSVGTVSIPHEQRRGADVLS